ncbi:MAG: hypothetical protein HZC38_07060 [Chloroflexi bacterium]|nr:hypothetical protein [Chloroflexota bacterium]MBI5350140.1 hypothetical protein [Chloroflexota bacterium]MBI5713167.1 hypothetical protein [Chloroflexota bacterium]
MSLLVFILAMMQWTRAITLFFRQSFLSEFALSISLPYAIAAAAVWGGVLLAASLALWRMKGWGKWLALAGVTASQSQEWFDRLVFGRSDYSQISLGFLFFISIIILILTWGILLRAKFD